LTNRHTP